jgi:hypothetical protein
MTEYGVAELIIFKSSNKFPGFLLLLGYRHFEEMSIEIVRKFSY